jgi:ATP-dependent protease ClpP protease subunit
MKSRLPIAGQICKGLDVAYAEALEKLVNNGCDELILEIDSQGGDLNVAARIVKSILASQLPVTALIENYAASAATYIAACCDQTFARPGATMLLHSVSMSASVSRNAEALDRLAAIARSTDEVVIAAYCHKTGLSAARVRSLMARGEQGEVLSLEEALDLGFVDGVLEWDVLDPPTPSEREATDEETVSEPSASRPRASASPERLDYAALTWSQPPLPPSQRTGASGNATKAPSILDVAAKTQQILAAARAAGILR